MESKYDEKKVERIFWYISLIMVIIDSATLIWPLVLAKNGPT